MKAFYAFFLVSLLVVTGCKNDRENPNQINNGKVSFSPMLLDPDARITQSLPAGAYLQISIETSEGVEVLTQHQMEILVFNGTLVSIALELDAGDYLLTEFLVMSPENEILYATPLETSPLADLVSEPVPISFSVVGSEAVQVDVQVLDIQMLTPPDIGYVSFPFTIVNHFFLAVFEPTENGLNLTDAMGYILQNGDTLKTFAINAEINAVTFSGEPDDTFTLIVIKGGFGKHKESLTIDGIIAENEQGIVPVTLQPALTFVAVPYEHYEGTPRPYVFQFNAYATGSLTIDWGDGSIEEVCPTNDDFTHEYGQPGSYFVSVTGDLENVSIFRSYYGFGPMSEIDVSHLSGLKEYRNGWTSGPKIIDLSNNLLIEYVDVGLSDVEELILPEANFINSLDIIGNTQLVTEDVEKLIDVLYASVVARGESGGYVSLVSMVDQAVAGPPSEAAVEKLRSLHYDYDWYIDQEFIE